MFGWLKKKNKEEATVKVVLKKVDTSNEVNEEGELLKKATAAYKDNNLDQAIAYIDKAIKGYESKGQKENMFPAIKKKCSYLYRNGRRDESWKILNEMVVFYGEDYITTHQIYDEMRKQMEFEKRFDRAFDLALMSRLFSHRSQLIQNKKYPDHEPYEVDTSWEEDAQFIKLAKKARITNWDEIKENLIEEYKKVNYRSNFALIHQRVVQKVKYE